MSDGYLTVQNSRKTKAPLIIPLLGHRLEGIWHSGSPMGMIINAKRIHVLVPRTRPKQPDFKFTVGV
jgi:hypothetical protein